MAPNPIHVAALIFALLSFLLLMIALLARRWVDLGQSYSGLWQVCFSTLIGVSCVDYGSDISGKLSPRSSLQGHLSIEPVEAVVSGSRLMEVPTSVHLLSSFSFHPLDCIRKKGQRGKENQGGKCWPRSLESREGFFLFIFFLHSMPPNCMLQRIREAS